MCVFVYNRIIDEFFYLLRKDRSVPSIDILFPLVLIIDLWQVHYVFLVCIKLGLFFHNVHDIVRASFVGFDFFGQSVVAIVRCRFFNLVMHIILFLELHSL